MNIRSIVISIAGFDPCGGAGVLADIKTFEQHQVMGFGVNTCITYQTEDKFLGLDWLNTDQILQQLTPLLKQYKVSAVKIGLIHFEQLLHVLEVLPKETRVVWDPILSASAGFDFQNGIDKESIKQILNRVHLVTPNVEEYQILELENNFLTQVLLKGGHQKNHRNDLLIASKNDQTIIEGKAFDKTYQKHGTGCILSAAIVSNLALGNSMLSACTLAKSYVEQVLESNDGLLGYHNL